MIDMVTHTSLDDHFFFASRTTFTVPRLKSSFASSSVEGGANRLPGADQRLPGADHRLPGEPWDRAKKTEKRCKKATGSHDSHRPGADQRFARLKMRKADHFHSHAYSRP